MTACERCGFDPDAKVLASHVFVIERDPPSLNRHIFNVGASRHAYRKERDAWCWEFRAVRLLQKIPKATGRRRITITRVFSGRQRERDLDNLIGGMKPVIDALVSEGFLVDDSPSSAELHYQQSRGTPAGVRFEVEVIG